MSDNGSLSDIATPDKRGGLRANVSDKAPPTIHPTPVIRADLTLVSDPAADPDDGVPAPLRRRGGASRTSAKAQERQAVPDPAPAVPSWAKASGRADGDPLFFAGASLALLDAFLRRDPPAAGALRARLALKSAAASAKILRLNVDEGALRDLRFAIGEAGPAARLLSGVAGARRPAPGLDAGRLAAAAAALDLAAGPERPRIQPESLRRGGRSGLSRRQGRRLRVLRLPGRPSGRSRSPRSLGVRPRPRHPVALGAALPLIATKVLDPGLRSRRGRAAKARRSGLAENRRRGDRPRRRRRAQPSRQPVPPRGGPARRSAQTARQAGDENRRPAARRGLRLARRGGAAGADDRPRRPPLVRPLGRAWRRARAHRPDRVPALRPVSAAPRRRSQESQESLDVDLIDLPPAARWREWMLRVEAAIFASARPVPREALVRVVGQSCRFDDLIADLTQELRGRPYDLALVAGGYALRTKTRFAPAIRAAHPSLGRDDVADLTRTETFALTAIAYLQPVTRGEVSRLAGREISRDIIASLKRHGLIDGAIRAPQPGAPFAYVTTKTFLEAFGFASLRDLPDIEPFKTERSIQTGQGEPELDKALGLGDGEDQER